METDALFAFLAGQSGFLLRLGHVSQLKVSPFIPCTAMPPQEPRIFFPIKMYPVESKNTKSKKANKLKRTGRKVSNR